jgi:hypothetical protein
LGLRGLALKKSSHATTAGREEYVFQTAKKPIDARSTVAMMVTRGVVVGRFWTQGFRTRIIAYSCDSILVSSDFSDVGISINGVKTFFWEIRIALPEFRFCRASQVILRRKPSPTTELWQRLVGYARLNGEIWLIIEYWPGF